MIHDWQDPPFETRTRIYVAIANDFAGSGCLQLEPEYGWLLTIQVIDGPDAIVQLSAGDCEIDAALQEADRILDHWLTAQAVAREAAMAVLEGND